MGLVKNMRKGTCVLKDYGVSIELCVAKQNGLLCIDIGNMANVLQRRTKLPTHLRYLRWGSEEWLEYFMKPGKHCNGMPDLPDEATQKDRGSWANWTEQEDKMSGTSSIHSEPGLTNNKQPNTDVHECSTCDKTHAPHAQTLTAAVSDQVERKETEELTCLMAEGKTEGKAKKKLIILSIGISNQEETAKWAVRNPKGGLAVEQKQTTSSLKKSTAWDPRLPGLSTGTTTHTREKLWMEYGLTMTHPSLSSMPDLDQKKEGWHIGRSKLMDSIQGSGRLKKAISRAGKRLEELTSDPKVNTIDHRAIVMIVADRYGKSASPFVASAIHKAVSENTNTRREIILEHLGKEFHHKGCTFDHACKACVTGGQGGLTDKIVRAHNNIKLNTENLLCGYFLEAIDQKVDQKDKGRKAEKRSKEHPKEPTGGDKQKKKKKQKKHKAEKEREETPPKATGSKEEKKKKKKKREKSPERSRERSRGRSRERARELRTIQGHKQSVVRFTQKGMDPSGLKDLNEEQLIALQGAINDSLQSRRDESEEGARAAKKTKEEPKEEAAKEEEEELPDYEGSEDEKPLEKTPKAVAKKRVLSSGSEETDESLKRNQRRFEI